MEEAPVDDRGSEGEIGDDGGEICGGAGESGVEGEGDAAALECVAGGDDYRIRHESAGERAEELGRNLDLLERSDEEDLWKEIFQRCLPLPIATKKWR